MYSSSFLTMSRHHVTLIPGNLVIKDHFFSGNWVGPALKPKENKLIPKFNLTFITKMTFSDDPLQLIRKNESIYWVFTFLHERNCTPPVSDMLNYNYLTRHGWMRHSFGKNKKINQRLNRVLCRWGWIAVLKHTSPQKM